MGGADVLFRYQGQCNNRQFSLICERLTLAVGLPSLTHTFHTCLVQIREYQANSLSSPVLGFQQWSVLMFLQTQKRIIQNSQPLHYVGAILVALLQSQDSEVITLPGSSSPCHLVVLRTNGTLCSGLFCLFLIRQGLILAMVRGLVVVTRAAELKLACDVQLNTENESEHVGRTFLTM